LVVFTSDHGDCVGAHRFNQKTVFYEESARIPLIVSWKGQTPQAISDKLVNTGIDILPTFLDCAGIPQPAHLPGRSLLPLALGHLDTPWRPFLVAQNDLSQSGQVDGLRPTMEGRMVRTARFKYCLYARGVRREALYDLQDDPLETVNLAAAPEYRQVVLEHRNLLREYAQANDDALVELLLANDVEPRPFRVE
jgi:arylsulfatase A-like enzyme